MNTSHDHWLARLKPFDKSPAELPFTHTLNDQELAQARRGMFPGSSDDRWVGLCLPDALVFARANNGLQIYRLPLTESGAGAVLGPLQVNGDSHNYRRLNDDHDIKAVGLLLEQLLNPKSPMW